MNVDQNPSPPVLGTRFEYAIKHEEYGYFAGTSRVIWRENFSHRRQDAYTYTQIGAHRKVDMHPHAFKGCEVVHLY